MDSTLDLSQSLLVKPADYPATDASLVRIKLSNLGVPRRDAKSTSWEMVMRHLVCYPTFVHSPTHAKHQAFICISIKPFNLRVVQDPAHFLRVK